MAQSNGIFTLQVKDFAKGAIIAFGTALLPSIYTMLDKDHFPTWIEFAPYLKAAVSALVMYIGKNYFSNNEGAFAKKDVPAQTDQP